MSSGKFVNKLKSMVKVTGCSSIILSGVLYYQNDEKFFEKFLMPLTRFLIPDAETAHKAAIKACSWNLVPSNNYEDPESLVSRTFK